MVDGMPYSFALSITDVQGKQILHYFPHVKIELAGPFKYIALELGETYTLSLHLPQIIKKNYPGKYSLAVTYHNQLGNRCFKGTITSLPIDLTIKS